jgi:pimeloyl-ACP methyl ester carboxylesterase
VLSTCKYLAAASLTVLLLSQTAHAEPNDPQVPGASILTETAELPDFGAIAYRPPIQGSSGLPIVLFHGVYGGASHRAFRELLPKLDSAGRAVYVMDLPGVGASAKPKRPYAIEDLDKFVESFLVNVVQGRATVVGESLTTLSVLRVAATRPDLVRRVVLLSPAGINSLSEPPSEREQKFYERLYADDAAGTAFYQNLLIDSSLRYYLSFGYFDDAKITDEVLDDYRVMREVTDQRWITLSFVGGQFYRRFEDAAAGVFVPVLAVFGKEYEPFADTPPTRASDLSNIRPDFETVEIESSGSSVQREQPESVAREIMNFSVQD